MDPQKDSKNNNEVSVAPHEVTSAESLEETLDKVLGDLKESIPSIKETPVAPTFELGAPPMHAHENEEAHTVMVKNDAHDEQEAQVIQHNEPSQQQEHHISTEESPQESVSVHAPHASSQKEMKQEKTDNDFHTISGGPETLKETLEKATPVVHRMTPVPQSKAAAIAIAKIFIDEKEYISSLLFFWASFITFITFIIGVAFPVAVDLLLSKGYLVAEEGGIYRHGTIAFPSALGDNMLTLTLHLATLSIVVLIITGSIDYVAKKQFGGVTRFVIHTIIMMLFMYVIFHFGKEQGVTFEQVRQVFLLIQESISHILQNIEENKPLFS